MIRKAMSAALTLVITIVVLIVVALALITITTENVADTGDNAQKQQDASACSIWKTTACAGKSAGIAVANDKIRTMECGCTCDGTTIKCPSEEVAPAP